MTATVAAMVATTAESLVGIMAVEYDGARDARSLSCLSSRFDRNLGRRQIAGPTSRGLRTAPRAVDLSVRHASRAERLVLCAGQGTENRNRAYPSQASR